MRNELDTIRAGATDTNARPDASARRLEAVEDRPVSADANGGPAQLFKCGGCKEVIGVYEPLVVLEGGHARSTSRAAEPYLEAALGDYYHRDCYASRHEMSLAASSRYGPSSATSSCAV